MDVRIVLLAVALATACRPSGANVQPSPRSEAAQAMAPGSTPPTVRWYPIADAAVPVPAHCSAKCSLDCDVWSGTIECPDEVGSIAVWGGLDSMAAMSLDAKGATAEGREPLLDGGQLRWGHIADGHFCATTAGPSMVVAPGYRGHWTWQFCAPDSPSRRGVILSIGRGYRKGPLLPEQVIKCENRGC